MTIITNTSKDNKVQKDNTNISPFLSLSLPLSSFFFRLPSQPCIPPQLEVQCPVSHSGFESLYSCVHLLAKNNNEDMLLSPFKAENV